MSEYITKEGQGGMEYALFLGSGSFLSNFYNREFTHRGHKFKTAEHAYQVG